MPTDPIPAAAPPALPTIYEAERESGAVLRGAVIDLAAAVARRRSGREVVVCRPDADADRRLAGSAGLILMRWETSGRLRRHGQETVPQHP